MCSFKMFLFVINLGNILIIKFAKVRDLTEDQDFNYTFVEGYYTWFFLRHYVKM